MSASFLIRNWPIIAALALLLVAYIWIGMKIKNAAEDARKDEQQLAKIERLETESANQKAIINIKRRQDEIRNRPRSDALTIERLHKATF